jgi:transposase InsO family protein
LFNGYSVILNSVDAFSKYAWSQPIKIQNAINIKKALEKIFNLIKLEFGNNSSSLINRIQFDKGTEFKNEIVEDFIKFNNIKVSYSSAYNFKSQSIVERFHQTIVDKANTLLHQSILLNISMKNTAQLYPLI